MKRTKIALIMFIVVCILLPAINACKNDTLRLLHVLFRHGNRTPDEVYPKDPYRNFTYSLQGGLGQLTKIGKQREYQIGTYLNKNYNCILDYYTPDLISARSTDYDRTKMSLELVLAGLFPPQGEQVWNPLLNWQPIPYSYASKMHDHLLGVPSENCPAYKILYDEQIKSIQYTKEDLELFSYLSNYTGLNVSKPCDVYNLFFTLETEREFGFKLPKWTDKVWPEAITSMTVNEFYVETANDKMKKLSGGFLLRKIIRDTEAKMNNTLTPTSRKIFMYSAHEVNLAYMLILLNVFSPHVPTYGSFIIVEVHEINGVYGFKFLYQNYTNDEPIVLKIPNCDIFCPFDKFVEILQNSIPTEHDHCKLDK